MANVLETFASVTQKNYSQPHPMPFPGKPASAPLNTESQLYLSKSDLEDCRCDAHRFENIKSRYKKLGIKERRLQNELLSVSQERANLMSIMLKSNCESENEIIKSVYDTDYGRRGTPIGRYRPLMAAVDSPIGSPIAPVVTGLRDGYRDPNRFRYSAMERPDIGPAQSLNLMTIPETFTMWNEPFAGRSEYMDTISEMGLSNMKNRQQYLEPLSSSRRKFDDCR